MPSKVILEEPWLILHYWTMWKFLADGASASTTSVVPDSCVQAGLIAGGKDAKEGRQTVCFAALDPMSKEPDEEYQELVETTKGTAQLQLENNPGCNLLD